MVQYINAQRVIGDGNSTCLGLQFDVRVVWNMFLFCAALRQLSKYISIYDKWDTMSGNENLGLIMPNLFIIYVGTPRQSSTKSILTSPGSI